jgi:hypothetical protein
VRGDERTVATLRCSASFVIRNSWSLQKSCNHVKIVVGASG